MLQAVQDAKKPIDWKATLSVRMLNDALAMSKNDLDFFFTGNTPKVSPEVLPYLVRTQVVGRDAPPPAPGLLLQRESKVAGYLLWLANKYTPALDLYFNVPKQGLWETLTWSDPASVFGQSVLSAVLSPIGIIHLFRQYFFEFTSFLGNPVGHVWVSPGTTVELFEISTRKQVIERSMEMATETTQKSESATTSQDELSDVVRDENKSDTKFGFTAEAKFTVPTFEASASSSLNLDSSRSTSRETTHKQMRQQSEKLSSEIKRSFKTTFSTSTEVTDTSSKRYVIQNTTDKLVNYELAPQDAQGRRAGAGHRRRRCAGTRSSTMPAGTWAWPSWSISAQPPELSSWCSPMLRCGQEPKSVDVSIQFAYENTPDSEGHEMDVIFYDGDDQEGGANNNDKIVWQRDYKADPPAPAYTMDSHIDWVSNHTPVVGAEVVRVDQTGKFRIMLHEVNFDDKPFIPFKVTTYWNAPPISADQQKAYDDALKAYDAEKARRIKEAYMNSIRDRIKQASEIRLRPSDDLREEERTVVYRRLIGQLMRAGDPTDRHITTELIRSMFDVEKMLYFVAPEWWAPRLHQSHESLGATPLTADDKVSWGGAAGDRADNYYITDESAPARLGASLGWLLQLDGDNMRNAFLNSPWVKAVIPIRPGKEMDALAWLQQGARRGRRRARRALRRPGAGIEQDQAGWAEGHDQGRAGVSGPAGLRPEHDGQPAAPSPYDPAKNVLPTEMVFEHGFYPLQGSFKLQQDALKVSPSGSRFCPPIRSSRSRQAGGAHVESAP